MKKNIISFIAVFLVLSTLITSTAFAATLPITTEIRSQQIDSLIDELNQIAAQETHISSDANAAKLYPRSQTLSSQKENIISELNQLGVNLVDPNDSATVTRLNSIIGAAEATHTTSSSTLNANSPDISEIATLYDVFEDTGTYYVDGVYYDTLAIYVTHNSDKEGILLNELSHHFLSISVRNKTLNDFTAYTIEFIADEFIGTLNWLITAPISYIHGALLDTYEPLQIVSTYGNCYQMSFNSTSAMVYYYVEMPNGSWVQCGASVASFQLARTDVIYLTVGSSPQNVSVSFPTERVTKSESHSLHWYIRDLLSSGSYHECTMGWLTVSSSYKMSNGSSPTFTYTPSFYSTISDLH